jgi:uncharacterized DUF497 family protein
MMIWDENKRISNLKKHGIDFLDCFELWDNLTVTREDIRYSYLEQRFITLGIVLDGVALVVHTDTVDGDVRLISARKAAKHERKYYYSKI